MSSDSKISKLWKTEDWLACWLGFIIIAIGAIAVLTKAFDFSALKFGTWHLWENIEPHKALSVSHANSTTR